MDSVKKMKIIATIIQAIGVVLYLYCWITEEWGTLYNTASIIVAVSTICTWFFAFILRRQKKQIYK